MRDKSTLLPRMIRRVSFAAGAVALALLFGLVMVLPAASAKSEVMVSIPSGAGLAASAPGYAPGTITVVIGVNNTVTWTNNDSAHHTVTTTSAPTGGDFDSGNMNGGVACTHTFTVPGSYQYDCTYHSWMKGTIVVKASP